MYYNDEIGAELEGFVDQPGNCGDICRCDDHVGRTDGKFDNLTSGEQDLKDYIAGIFNLRDRHPALAIGTRTHVYSDEYLFIDLKSYKNDKVLYILNVSEGNAEIKFKSGFWQRLVGENFPKLKDLVTEASLDSDVIKIPGLSGTFIQISK